MKLTAYVLFLLRMHCSFPDSFWAYVVRGRGYIVGSAAAKLLREQGVAVDALPELEAGSAVAFCRIMVDRWKHLG